MGRRWSDKEILFLEDNWGNISIPRIAKKLNRTITAIKLKASRLGFDRHLHSMKYITFNQLLIALGLNNSHAHYKKLFTKYGIPTVNKKSINKIYPMININDFWKWAYDNKLILNFSRFEKGLLGKEPDWVNIKRNQDIMNPAKKNHNRRWTKFQDNLLIDMLKTNRYTCFEIAKDLNRTEKSIKTRIRDLKIPYKPVPANNHIKWTNEEKNSLYNMVEKGYDAYTISKILNKTELAVKEKIR
ncbi:MAG: hypothetical protein ACRDBY_08605, partial [Cetobacterium sp.]